MEVLDRLHAPLTPDHLRLFAKLAVDEHEDFFHRNPAAALIYRSRFLAAALCQGAALHYLGRGNGMKDVDIHLFYEQHPDRRQVARKVRSIVMEVPGFGERKVDFIKTVVPSAFVTHNRRDLVVLLRAFLTAQPTDNASHLAEKAVVGLVPESILATVIWPISR